MNNAYKTIMLLEDVTAEIAEKVIQDYNGAELDEQIRIGLTRVNALKDKLTDKTAIQFIKGSVIQMLSIHTILMKDITHERNN